MIWCFPDATAMISNQPDQLTMKSFFRPFSHAAGRPRNRVQSETQQGTLPHPTGYYRLLFALCWGLIPASFTHGQSSEPVSLFDGKTLTGWVSNEGVWRIQDGAITAGSPSKAFPRNEFICTEKSYIKELPPTPGAPTWESLGGVAAAFEKVKTKRQPRKKPKGQGKAPTKPKGATKTTPARGGTPYVYDGKGKKDTSYNRVEGDPQPAGEQAKLFHVPEGYEIELVARESEGIGKFISVYFDQRGRLWTQTALEYPVDANENAAVAEALYKRHARDKVLVYPRESLADLPEGGLTNPTVFADGLAMPLGILPWGNGDSAYVLHGHDLVLLTDTDGDGRSDKRKVILTGFGIQDSHLFPHQFTRAPGGWIWMAQGLFNNSNVKRPGDRETVPWRKCSMARMRPDGSGFEVTSTGPNNIWGLALTGEGEAFIQEANDFGYPVMPFHEFAYYPGGMKALKKSYQPSFPPTAEFRMGRHQPEWSRSPRKRPGCGPRSRPHHVGFQPDHLQSPGSRDAPQRTALGSRTYPRPRRL